MRPLFLSEHRCVTNLFQSKWGQPAFGGPSVISESVAPPVNPRHKPWFNSDFILNFVDWRANKSERAAAVCSVLPNAVGAELFLVVERDSLSPTALELNGGRAFSIQNFEKYISVVERAVQASVGKQNGRVPRKAATSLEVGMAAFARVLVVGDDITFLYFPNETAAAPHGSVLNLAKTGDQEIQCYVDSGEIVCFDGWMRVNVAQTWETLVSMPAEADDI